MTSTEKVKKTANKPTPAPAVQEKAVKKEKQEISFGVPIDTDKIRVEVEGTTIKYHIKATGEKLSKDYENMHAVMIIYGRISRDPHGEYTQACIGKIRAASVRRLPL